MRYIVREGSVRGKGRYWRGCLDRWSISGSRCAFTYSCRDLAESCANLYGGRIVRLLSHKEAKAKAAAEALRDVAADMRIRSQNAIDAFRLERIADTKWPRKQARHG